MTKMVVPYRVSPEEALRHQALVELLERQHPEYDIAIAEAVGWCRTAVVHFYCVPKEGLDLSTVMRVACVATDRSGVPSRVVRSNISGEVEGH